MKIKKGKVYQMKLSGDQILLIQAMIVNGEIHDSLSESGKEMAQVLYESLEEDVEEVDGNKR